MQVQLEGLIKAGATIDEKYDMLWKNQMARRDKLAMLGQASGMWKALISYLAGHFQSASDRRVDDVSHTQ